MKKLYSLLFCSIAYLGIAQIPNADFENWNNNSYTTPAIWNFFGNITQVQGVNGNYAVRMERSINGPGAIIHGNPQGNVFWGGLPTTDRPDSLVGNFNYSIAPNDTAWVLVIFKSNGVPISMDLNKITGNSGGNYIHLGFKNNFTSGLTPDSVVVGVTSSNPDDTLNPMGGFMMIDDLQFKDASGTTYPIANGDFENWNLASSDEPIDWFTSNSSYIPYLQFPATKTTDAQNGTYAIRLENLTMPFGIGYGYALAGPQGQNGPMPGFPVTQRDSSLNGYYKFFPQNTDTAMMYMVMFYQGTQVGWGFYQEFNTVNTYTYFSTPIYYDGMFFGVPDSATIVLAPFKGGSNPSGNSVLFIDNLSLNSQSVSLKSHNQPNNKMFVYPNPATDYTNVNYLIEKESMVTINVYDITGKLVETIKNEKETAGSHMFKYDLRQLTSGIYSIEIKTKNYSQIEKISVQH